MNSAIIVCEGFETENIVVPPFVLMPYDVISLEWPLIFGHPASQHALNILDGRQRHRSIKHYGSVRLAGCPMFKITICGSVALGKLVSRIVPFKFRQAHWKIGNERYAKIHNGKVSRLSMKDANKIRGFLGLTSENSLVAIEGTGRKIIGLHMGFENADAVIFDTLGFNAERIYEVLQRYVDQGKAALEIAYPCDADTPPPCDTYPGAIRLVVALKGEVEPC